MSWRKVNWDLEWDYRAAKVEALREIADQSKKRNELSEKIYQTLRQIAGGKK
jgi:hypothetical protein